jgi:iron complex outermembrane receptor protein
MTKIKHCNLRQRSNYPLILMTGLTIMATAISSAFAQEATPVAPPQSAEPKMESVVVTGSKIVRPGYVSSSPIISASSDDLRASGKINVETSLQQMPQFAPAQDESYNAQANGGGGRATVNLRSLGESRTLVLLDGRRLTPSNGQMVVDLNSIPMGIVSDIEVITGGASAVYGSDAVAGVVNIRTKRRFEGVQVDVTHGQAQGGGAGRTDVSATMGSKFADNRGNFLMSLNYSQRDELAASERPFYSVGGPSGTTFFGGYAPAATNLPTQAAVNSVFAKYGAGTVSNAGNLYANNDGTLFNTTAPLQNYRGPGAEAGYDTNTGSLIYNTQRDALLTVPQKRYTGFAKGNLNLTGDIEAYGQVMLNQSTVSTRIGYSVTAGGAQGLTIPVSNPYIPADLKAILASRPNPSAPFTYVNRLYPLGTRQWNEVFDTYQLLAGLKGAIGPIDGDWDLSYSHGSVTNTENRLNVPFIAQTQAILGAPDGGASICAGGFNPFAGTNATLSDACKSYMTGTTHTITNVIQDDVQLALQGKVMRLPAGEMRFAAGAGYRSNSYNFDPDAMFVKGLGVAATVTNPTYGKVSVKEMYGELLVPLLKKAFLAESLNLDFGFRKSNYNYSGSASTYKANFDWQVTPGLLLRGGYDRAIRAPNPFELFSAPNGNTFQIGAPPNAGDPCDVRSAARLGANGAQVAILCGQTGVSAPILNSYRFTAGSINTSTTGNLGLKPEVADTFTAGAVISPKWDSAFLHRPTLTVDYYRIKLAGAIAIADAPTSMSKCYNLDGSNPSYSASNFYCGLLLRDPNTAIVTAQQPYLNLGGIHTAGVDIQLEDTIKMSDFGLPTKAGSLHLSSTLSYLRTYQVSPTAGAAFVEFADTVNIPTASTAALPKWRALTSINYTVGRYSAGLRWRYLAAMRDVTAVTRPASPASGVPVYNFVDLNFGAKLTDQISIDGGVTNLSKKNPPVVGGVPGQTNNGLYDPLGQTFFVHLAAKF